MDYLRSNQIMKYLETSRFFLREFIEEDIQRLFELDSDPDVMKWLTNGASTDMPDIQASFIKMKSMLNKYNGAFGFWAAIESSTNEFLGWFHLRPGLDDLDNLEKVELGYRLFKKNWGRGYATEGCLALIEKAFNELDVREVFATTMKKNIGSRRVMEKAGLRFSHEYYEDRFPIKEEKAVYYSLQKNSSTY